MNATADRREIVPIVEDDPEQTRRLTALLEAHRQGVIFFGGSTAVEEEDGRSFDLYGLIYRGRGYALRPEEVLPAVYFMAAGLNPDLADRLKYRAGLHARPHLSPDLQVQDSDTRPIFLTDGQRFHGPFQVGDVSVVVAEQELSAGGAQVHVIRAKDEGTARAAWATMAARSVSS